MLIDSKDGSRDTTGLLLDFQNFQMSAISSGMNLSSAELTSHVAIVFININAEYGCPIATFVPRT